MASTARTLPSERGPRLCRLQHRQNAQPDALLAPPPARGTPKPNKPPTQPTLTVCFLLNPESATLSTLRCTARAAVPAADCLDPPPAD